MVAAGVTLVVVLGLQSWQVVDLRGRLAKAEDHIGYLDRPGDLFLRGATPASLDDRVDDLEDEVSGFGDGGLASDVEAISAALTELRDDLEADGASVEEIGAVPREMGALVDCLTYIFSDGRRGDCWDSPMDY